MNQILVDPNILLQQQVTDYIPSASGGYLMHHRKRPMLTHYMLREMLIDPRIQFGLALIKGPMLAKAKFAVASENEEVKLFVMDFINDFWNNGAVQALKAIEWGFSGSEVLYQVAEETGQIVYNGLKDFESPSVKVVTKNGTRCGILIDHFTTVSMKPGKAVYLGGPKALHHVHRREIHPHYGRSRLNGAHIPWNEIWCDGGYRDIRRVWFYQNAFDGGICYHPEGHFQTKSGQQGNYQDLAQEMMEKRRSGATITFPSKFDNHGNKLWDYVSPKGNTIPAGLFEYGDSLRIEILEAMGIPYEVIEASGNEGFGSSSGRQIPETAFYSILQEQLNWLMYDVTNQLIKPLIQINAALGRLPFASVKVLPFQLESSAMMDAEGPQIEKGKENENQSSGDSDSSDDTNDSAKKKKKSNDNDSDQNNNNIEDKTEKRLSVAVAA